MSIRSLTALAPALLSTFASARQIEVDVADPVKTPIVGATVTVPEGAQRASATTGVDGRCTLPLAPAPRPIRLRVEAPGFFHVDSQWLAKDKIDVSLRRAVALEGRLRVFGTQTPVAGARIEIPHPGCRACAPEVAICDADGRFSFASLPSGLELTLHAGAASVPRQTIVLGALDGTNGAGRELELDPGHLIRGRVVDFQSGAPLADALVETIPGRLNQVRSGADGRFELTAVAESFRQLLRFEVTAEGHCRLGVVLSATEIQPGKELRCPVPGLARITGVVFDAQGERVPGAEVFVREDPNWLAKRRARGAGPPLPFDDLPSTWTVSSGEANAKATCDAAGSFVFERVCPWMPEVLVQSQHPVVGGVQKMVGPVGAPGTSLAITLEPTAVPPGGRIEGTLTFNGQPTQAVLGWRGATRKGPISVDSRGRYSGSGIEPGEVLLSVVLLKSPTGALGRLFASESVTLQVALNEVSRHEFVLEHPMATIAGRVVDARGLPKAQVAVSAHEPTLGMQCNGATDAEGRFELRVPQVELDWRVQAPFGPLTLERTGVRAGGAELEFVAPDLGRLHARFVDAKTGASLAPAMILWRHAGAVGFETRSLALEPERDEQGWMRATIPAGEWELAAWVAKASYPPTAPRRVTIGADQVLQLDFALLEGRPATLKLAESSAKPPRDPSGAVWMLEVDWWARREDAAEGDMSRSAIALPPFAERFRILAFDDEWKAQVPGLKPGRYRFVTATPGDSVEPREIELRGDESAPIEIRWSRAP